MLEFLFLCEAFVCILKCLRYCGFLAIREKIGISDKIVASAIRNELWSALFHFMVSLILWLTIRIK